MRFLADESCDHAVVRALRAASYDVTSIAEISPSISDEQVADLALAQNRVLITEDKDFGQLVYAASHALGAVILIRYPAPARASLPAAVIDLVTGSGEQLRGQFVVMQPGRTRMGRSPLE